MKTLFIQESKTINAPAHIIYDIFADFHDAHVAILPKPYFDNIEILEGGLGHGTRYILTMNIFGNKQSGEMHVTEPKPGHTLRETAVDGSVVTDIIVTPHTNGQQTQVTIESTFKRNPGLRGFMERLTLPLLIPHIYKKELQNVADYVQQTQPALNDAS